MGYRGQRRKRSGAAEAVTPGLCHDNAHEQIGDGVSNDRQDRLVADCDGHGQRVVVAAQLDEEQMAGGRDRRGWKLFQNQHRGRGLGALPSREAGCGGASGVCIEMMHSLQGHGNRHWHDIHVGPVTGRSSGAE